MLYWYISTKSMYMKKLIMMLMVLGIGLSTFAQTRQDTTRKKTEKTKPMKKSKPAKKDTSKRDTMRRDTLKNMPPR